MRKDKRKKTRKERGVILLEDLAPRQTVTGGSAKIFFGQRVEGAEEERAGPITPARTSGPAGRPRSA
jgi:hypothetical protein